METELLTSQITAGYAASTLIEWLKRQAWFPFATTDNAKLNRAFAGVMAFATAIGLHFTFDSDAGVLTIAGLTVANIAHTAWAWVQQYALQQFMYKSVVKRPGGAV